MLKKLLLTIFLTAPVLVYSQKHYTIAELEEKLNMPTEGSIQFVKNQGFDNPSNTKDPMADAHIINEYINGTDPSRCMFIGYSINNNFRTTVIGYCSLSKEDLKLYKQEMKAKKEYKLTHRDVGVWVYRHKSKSLGCEFGFKYIDKKRYTFMFVYVVL